MIFNFNIVKYNIYSIVFSEMEQNGTEPNNIIDV